MPRYHFAVLNTSSRHEDQEGTELPDDAAAREYAIRVIRELRRGEGDNWKGWVLEVTQGDRLVWQLPFEAIEPDVPSR
jgi:hypothetical protein